MPSATTLIIAALKDRVTEEELQAIQDNAKAEAAEIQQLRDDVAALKSATPASGAPSTDDGSALSALTVRVQALEDRNAADDAEAAGLEPAETDTPAPAAEPVADEPPAE